MSSHIAFFRRSSFPCYRRRGKCWGSSTWTAPCWKGTARRTRAFSKASRGCLWREAIGVCWQRRRSRLQKWCIRWAIGVITIDRIDDLFYRYKYCHAQFLLARVRAAGGAESCKEGVENGFISQRNLSQDWGIFVVNFIHIIHFKISQRTFIVLNFSIKAHFGQF